MLATLRAGKGAAPMMDNSMDDATTSRVRDGLLGPWTEHLQILSLLAQGRTYGEIAGELHLTEPTVRRRAEALVAAIGARNPVQAVALLLRLGIIRL